MSSWNAALQEELFFFSFFNRVNKSTFLSLCVCFFWVFFFCFFNAVQGQFVFGHKRWRGFNTGVIHAASGNNAGVR